MSDLAIDPNIVQRITELAHHLSEAIDSGDRDKILAAQQNLSGAAERIWATFEQEHTGKSKAIARVLADMAIHDLPQSIQDPANYPAIQHKLRLLKNSLVLLK